MLNKRTLLLAIVAISFFAFVFKSSKYYIQSESELASSKIINVENTDFSFTVANEYPKLQAIDYYIWDYIVEPYRESILSVVNNQDNAEFTWMISFKPDSYKDDQDPDILISDVHGETITVKFTKPAQSYSVKVTQRWEDENGIIYQESHLAIVMCKYVRRELRSLTEDDKARYLSALSVVHKYDLDKGQKKFGENFKNYHYFVKKHVNKMVCTPFHSGLSFITSHAAFTLELEKSLQSIDPIVAQPYWDYTIDSLMYGSKWVQSPIFSDDWFGPATPENPYNIIETGYFAFSKVITNRSLPVHNAYGRVTEVINNDPSYYVTRSHDICGLPSDVPLPGCTELLGCLQTRNLFDLHDCLESELHQDLHIMFGGIWDCPYSINTVLAKHEKWSRLLYYIAMQSVGAWSDMWGTGEVICPTYCEDGVPFEDCSCGAPAIDAMDPKDLTFTFIYKYLEKTERLDTFSGTDFIYPTTDDRLPGQTIYKFNIIYNECDESGCQEKIEPMTPDENEEFLKWYMLFSTHPGKLGAMSTGASINDPIFWPIHPVFDRIWAFMRLAPQFSDFNSTWVDGDSCYGRNSNDILPFYDLFNEQDGHYYSNLELAQLFHPLNPVLPYIYDSFSWDHCTSS